jgi:hypothetical protein
MKRPNVVFSDFALRGLEKKFPDPERRLSAKYSIEWHLKRDETLDKSRSCPAFTDKEMYLFPLSDMKILFEKRGDEVLVWSVSQYLPESF